jgi:hypothetical protein
MKEIISTREWALSKSKLESQFTKRSQVSYFRHVEQGVRILDCIDADLVVMKAFCLHPLLQADKDLIENGGDLAGCDPHAVLLAMEYRAVANAGIRSTGKMELSILPEVNQMLVADKVQNYSDFLLFHAKDSPEYASLETYFSKWLNLLNITPEKFDSLSKICKQT